MIRVSGLEQKQTKNRSSKHLKVLTGLKSSLTSMSGEELSISARKIGTVKGGNVFDEEIQRRENNASKRKTPRPKRSKGKA